MFQIKVWIPVDIDPEEDTQYTTKEDAEKEKTQLEEIQPENIYEVIKVGEGTKIKVVDSDGSPIERAVVEIEEATDEYSTKEEKIVYRHPHLKGVTDKAGIMKGKGYDAEK